MQDGCKVYMDSYMASNGPCFMVTWTKAGTRLLAGSWYRKAKLALGPRQPLRVAPGGPATLPAPFHTLAGTCEVLS